MPLLIVDPLPHQAQMPMVTRAIDIVAATMLLVVTAPIWLVVSLAILIEEPGPVFYRATRVGLGGREFIMFKFRKMRRDATGPMLTLASDDRFTRIGRILARTKLDELPQLLNVLRGEMGLVGPRPEGPLLRRPLPRRVRGDLARAPGHHGALADPVPGRVVTARR